jgi:hypothetical protein
MIFLFLRIYRGLYLAIQNMPKETMFEKYLHMLYFLTVSNKVSNHIQGRTKKKLRVKANHWSGAASCMNLIYLSL